jgi:VIT1/CCC1 family predicted Fe2+/Mn2+ transporter/rubrerythrin
VEKTDLWLENLHGERDGAALYGGLAKLEKDPGRAESFRRLAEGERRHAEVWARKLESLNVQLPPDEPSARVRALLWLAGRLGVQAVLPLALEAEVEDADKYAKQGEDAAALAADENEHRAVLAEMGGGEAPQASEVIARRERWHRAGRGAGALRAAVFGMNDGLVSILSLVLGVAGAGVPQETLILTGMAGLLAGAFSMAAGEFTSVASQRDLLRRQVELERRELAETPDEEQAELVLIFKHKGLSTEQAVQTARELMKNPEAAVDTLVREELGLDPGDLGSPLAAALSSFATFSVGAVVPLLPFFFAGGTVAVLTAAGLALGILAGVGAGLGFLSGTSPLRSAARMAGLASLAAGVTYGLGRLFGTTLT